MENVKNVGNVENVKNVIAPDYRITMISGVHFLTLFLCRRDEHSQVEKTWGGLDTGGKHLRQTGLILALWVV